MKELKHFILVGAPASGKGTQGRFLADTFGLHSLSTGSLLRREWNPARNWAGKP